MCSTEATLDMRSDNEAFHVTITLRAERDGELVAERNVDREALLDEARTVGSAPMRAVAYSFQIDPWGKMRLRTTAGMSMAVFFSGIVLASAPTTQAGSDDARATGSRSRWEPCRTSTRST